MKFVRCLYLIFLKFVRPTKLDIAKRNVLTILAMSYDPTRLLQPVLTNLKRFFKEICKHKFGWNEIISEDFRKEFEKIILSLQEIEKISVPINILLETDKQIKLELYGFSNDRKKKYRACVYLRQAV